MRRRVAEGASQHAAMVGTRERDNNLDGSAKDASAHNDLRQACAQCRGSERALELFAAIRNGDAVDIGSSNIRMKLLLSEGQIKRSSVDPDPGGSTPGGCQPC